MAKNQSRTAIIQYIQAPVKPGGGRIIPEANTNSDEKAVFELVYFKGYSFAAAALKLNIPEKVLMEKVKTALR